MSRETTRTQEQPIKDGTRTAYLTVSFQFQEHPIAADELADMLTDLVTCLRSGNRDLDVALQAVSERDQSSGQDVTHLCIGAFDRARQQAKKKGR